MQILYSEVNPLDYALKNAESQCDLIVENPKLQEMLRKCFAMDYKSRPSSEQIYEHEFFRGYTI